MREVDLVDLDADAFGPHDPRGRGVRRGRQYRLGHVRCRQGGQAPRSGPRSCCSARSTCSEVEPHPGTVPDELQLRRVVEDVGAHPAARTEGRDDEHRDPDPEADRARDRRRRRPAAGCLVTYSPGVPGGAVGGGTWSKNPSFSSYMMNKTVLAHTVGVRHQGGEDLRACTTRRARAERAGARRSRREG